jgi:DNA polymerase I-like protein with 3'-5' exonuclease and polymerase domains
MKSVPTILVDRRNEDLIPAIIDKVRAAAIIGLDCETYDTPHPGILAFRKSDDAKVFDLRRTVVTGLSIFLDGDECSFYFNLNHRDQENKLPWPVVKSVLDGLSETAIVIAHNAVYERSVFKASLGYELRNLICTMIMAVSAYGPDEYSMDAFATAGLGEMAKIMGSIGAAFAGYAPGSELNPEQNELLYKIIGKQSKAAFSYNGFVKNIAYGYNLKKAVKSHFGFQMKTFEETLGDARNMGELTGEQVADYGGDDAFWAVQLFHKLISYMLENCPAALDTFQNQENPMIEVYSDIWLEGMKVNPKAIASRRDTERHNCAEILRKMKKIVNGLLPFEAGPNTRLMELDSKWYVKFAEYRTRIEKWAKSVDSADDYVQCAQVGGAVIAGWNEDKGVKTKATGPNFTHYMMMRTLIYDLLRERPMHEQGKTQSDGEARGKLIQRLEKKIAAFEAQEMSQSEDGDIRQAAGIEADRLMKGIELIRCINELAGVEQRMKLYLNPYTQLTDPETGRMYPQVSSLLASRRMASSNPNGMQLAKEGESTYIRGFYLPDNVDHVILSMDWSQIELVLIGEESGDPEFSRAYSQLPYQDMHLGAAADILTAIYGVEVTEEMFKSLKDMPDDVEEPFGFPLVDETGRRLTPREAYKYNRGTAGGKGANFGYWYSGALSSVAQSRGVGPDLMWQMTERYRQRFAVAEEWRVQTINEAQVNGYVTLPDGHRRVRFESTPLWAMHMRDRFGAYLSPGISAFGDIMIKKIQRRSHNQIVNSKIQGTCATLAKRSIVKGKELIKREGFDARFLMPIHDELLWSVNRKQVIDFKNQMYEVMTNHPDIVSKLKMHSTAAIGRNFEPFHPVKAPFGQVELDEMPALKFLTPGRVGKAANQNEVDDLLEYMRVA